MSFTASAARTIPWVGWMALGDPAIEPPPMVWPPKEPADLLDFSVSLAAWLADAGEDTVTAITVTPLTTVPGDVAINPPLIYSAQIVTAWLQYGQGGASYGLEYAVTTAGGRSATFVVTLPVLDTLPTPSPPMTPPAPVSWP